MTIGGMEIDPDTGQLTFTYGDRVAATTEGTLVCLLPTMHEFSESLTFPDADKGWIYAWRGKQDYQFNPSSDPDEYGQQAIAQTFFTRLPEEYEDGIDLIDAPDGADFFIGLVRINRTISPSHQWFGKTLAPLQPTDVWIPWVGSGLMEVGVGIVRAMHLVIEGGKLRLIAQQTVGPPVGGASHTWGHYPSLWSIGSDREGGIFEHSGTPGPIAWTSTAEPYRRSSSRTIATDGLPTPYVIHQRTGSQPASTTDPTSYQSVYSVDVKGWFGRRS